jgi:hypothetical protein
MLRSQGDAAVESLSTSFSRDFYRHAPFGPSPASITRALARLFGAHWRTTNRPWFRRRLMWRACGGRGAATTAGVSWRQRPCRGTCSAEALGRIGTAVPEYAIEGWEAANDASGTG